MPNLSFTAPTTVDEAVRMLAGARRLGQAAVRRNRSSGAAALGPDEARNDRRHSSASRPDRHPRGGRRVLIGAATPGVVMENDAALKAAWPGIVEGMDLIGSQQIQGRVLARRQSVQRLAGRRQRARR